MSLLVQIIEKCLSPDNVIRKNAEQELMKYCDQNLFEILSQFSNFIAQDSTPSPIRQFCGTFLKHIFLNEKYASIWFTFSPEQKNLIKNNILGSLASENDETKRTCSMAIASLAKIEIPKGWNIIEIICNAATHQNINYKITSLITLQNIIDYLGNEQLQSHEKQKILLSLTTNMSKDMPVQVINQAIVGFNKIIPFIGDYFKNEKERTFMINLLLDLLEPNYISKVSLDKILETNILICMTDIVKLYALYLQNNFTNIANMTFRYFNCNNKSLSTLSIELWSTVCDEEESLRKNIITSNYQDSLIESILRVIETRDVYNFVESEEWTPTKAVVILLSGLVTIGNKKILDRMLKYISECFNNNLVIRFDSNIESLTQDEKIKALIIKENAYLIYRGILYSKDIDSEVILNSLNKIINELKNNSIIPIGKSITLCLIVICSVQFDLVNEKQEIFDWLIQELIQLMEFHINNKIILNCLCLSLKHIFQNAYSQYFNKHLANIIRILNKIAYDKNSYNKDLNLTQLSMFLIGNIIEICEDIPENKNIIQLFFSDLYTQFQNSLNINNFLDKEKQICYQNSILSIIMSCSEFQKITMDATQITCVYNLIEQCLQQRGCLFEDAIMALGSLSYFGWELFSNINSNVMKYILFSLEERQNFQLCYQGLLASDDIISLVGKENISVIPQIVEKMQKILNDPNIPRGLKIKCFPLYNDIFLTQDKSNGDYLEDVIKLLIEGMNSSNEVPPEDTDIDTLEYLNELRAKIVELLTGVFMFLTNQNQTNAFSPYIDGFVKYLSKIVQPEYKLDISLISDICGVLADLYNHFRGSVELHFSQSSLKIIFERLEKSNNPQHIEVLNYSKQVLYDFDLS